MVDRSALLDYCCANSAKLFQLHVLAWVMFVLNTASVIAITPDPQSQVIIAVNYVGIGATILATGTILVTCRHR